MGTTAIGKWDTFALAQDHAERLALAEPPQIAAPIEGTELEHMAWEYYTASTIANPAVSFEMAQNWMAYRDQLRAAK